MPGTVCVQKVYFSHELKKQLDRTFEKRDYGKSSVSEIGIGKQGNWPLFSFFAGVCVS